MALAIRRDRTPASLRLWARRTGDTRAASRAYAIAHALEGMSRAEAARLAGMERQQGEATREIATKVQEIARATNGATQAMRDVCRTAEQSGVMSNMVLGVADGVAGQSDGLRRDVDHFLSAMVAVQKNDERRDYEPIAGGAAPVRLRCATYGSGTATLQSISLGGAALVGEWPCDVGGEILVGLPHQTEFASARIVDSRNGRLSVAFRQDPATQALVTSVMQALIQSEKQAA